MIFTGQIFVFGDHVNTDEIIPARFLNTTDPCELALSCMEDIRPGFGRLPQVKGSILVAGRNFGCGSSREHAPLALKSSGIICIIAQSFARIFLRNAINIGLPIVELPEVEEFSEGNKIKIDLAIGKVENISLGKKYTFQPYPPFLAEIVASGGWLNFAKKHSENGISSYFHDIAQFPYRIENISW